ncbi:phosphoglycerate mutase [Coprinopsis sp. MPI-PUGE-AT-0042]|nr:phosphoglycerate mutase [Coprinopsis sp. MPI-PUGE-AT-0042]
MSGVTVAEGPAPTAEKSQVKNKVCLIVHDGWGIAAKEGIDGNAIEAGTTANMDTIAKEHSFRSIRAHGTAVGLNEGLMGNSEVGHLNIGAGRVVWQDIVRIDVSIKKKTFHKNPTILEACKRAKEGSGRLHLPGLISDGGVHSHIKHLFALLETAKEQGVPETYIHFFGDGRDTAPRSSTKYLQQLGEFTDQLEYGELATIVGRYYAMDRDKRWERIKIAALGLMTGKNEKGEEAESVSANESKGWEGAVKIVEDNYKKDLTDEFLKPIIVNGDKGRVKEGDTLFFFNYRSDRMREIASVFGVLEDVEELTIPKDLGIFTMSQYKKEFPFVAFPPQPMTNVLAEWLAKKGVKQPHVAETRDDDPPFSLYHFLSLTEKYAHVPLFFNGGVKNDLRDLEPKMSVHGVADNVAEILDKEEYEFVMCNFAPPDMVVHAGLCEAAVEAITGTDAAVGTICKAPEKCGYVLLITVDHGNAEQMKDPKTSNPGMPHTTNPVPFITTGNPPRVRRAMP